MHVTWLWVAVGGVGPVAASKGPRGGGGGREKLPSGQVDGATGRGEAASAQAPVTATAVAADPPSGCCSSQHVHTVIGRIGPDTTRASHLCL